MHGDTKPREGVAVFQCHAELWQWTLAANQTTKQPQCQSSTFPYLLHTVFIAISLCEAYGCCLRVVQGYAHYH